MDKPFPAYDGDEPYVFVCYSHHDEDMIFPEIGWLHEQGIHIWYDEGTSAGKVWRTEIANALDGASHVLLYLSPNLLTSPHCDREINFALDRDKRIIPIYLEPTKLTGDLELGLSRIQAIKVSGTRYNSLMTDYQRSRAAVETGAGVWVLA